MSGEVLVKGSKRQKWKLSKIKQGFRTLIKKQLILINGQLGAEYLVILPNINVTSKQQLVIISFSLSCKKNKNGA